MDKAEFQRRFPDMEACEKEYIDHICAQSKWFEPQFTEMLVTIVKDLNNFAEKCAVSQQISPHIAALGLDPKQYTLRSSKTLHRVSPLHQQGCFEVPESGRRLSEVGS